MFYVDVAKASLDAAYVASVSNACFKFVENVSSIFQTYVCKYFLFGCNICFTHVARVYSNGFSCFSLMKQ
jgi:hypothetical protein